MRAVVAPAAMVALVMVVSGCRGGGSKSMWPFGRDKGYESIDAGEISGPQLPSAGAMSEGAAPGGGYNYNYNAPPAAGPYDQAHAGGYPGSTAYAAPPPDAHNNAYAQAPAYGAVGGTAPPYVPPAQGGVAPQAGPYTEHYPHAGAEYAAQSYGQPPVDHAPPAAYQAPAAVAQTPAADNSGQVYTNPYATAPADPHMAAPAADSYAAAPYPATADAGAVPGYGATAQTPTDHYGADASYGAAAPPADARYQPGNTGYNPPGVAPYEPQGVEHVASRDTPHYRPGSTSDYLPSRTSVAAPGGAADRYGAPATATAPGWPQGY